MSGHEMLADIVTWLRDPKIKSPMRKTWRDVLADRIEAAWKREKSEAEADALSVGGIVEAARHTPGNAAAMREALELALDALISWLNGTIDRTTNRETIKAIRAALAAPPRQCDVGTADDQFKRYLAFCHSESRGCKHCPANRTRLHGTSNCDLVWAQTPYEAQEGAGK